MHASRCGNLAGSCGLERGGEGCVSELSLQIINIERPHDMDMNPSRTQYTAAHFPLLYASQGEHVCCEWVIIMVSMYPNCVR